MSSDAEDEGRQAERVSPPADRSHGQPRHHLPGREHQAARHRGAATLAGYHGHCFNISITEIFDIELTRSDLNITTPEKKLSPIK